MANFWESLAQAAIISAALNEEQKAAAKKQMKQQQQQPHRKRRHRGGGNGGSYTLAAALQAQTWDQDRIKVCKQFNGTLSAIDFAKALNTFTYDSSAISAGRILLPRVTDRWAVSAALHDHTSLNDWDIRKLS